MDWFRTMDGYCERTGAAFWAEPVNALSNAAFLLAALGAWRLATVRRDRAGQALALILAAIGIGSFLFHTVAQFWAMLADVVPIQIFILAYLGVATVRFFRTPWWAGVLAISAFIPLSSTGTRLIEAAVGSLNGSAGYAPVPILIAAYALALGRRAPEVARGLAIGAGLLALSLTFRTVDDAICAAWPLGTHFLWHMLNATMLWWMIRVLVMHGPVISRRSPTPSAP